MTKVQELDHVLVLALRAAALEKESAPPAQLETSAEGSLDSDDDEGAVTPLNVSVTEHPAEVHNPASPTAAVDDSEDDDNNL